MKIAIDPGHGLNNAKAGKYDPGASAGGVTEAEIALQYGLTLKHILTQAGIECWMTRTHKNDSAPVGTRDNRANAEKCTHFISFHMNSSVLPLANGTEVFYRDDADKRLAEKVLPKVVTVLGLRDRGVKPESKTHHGRLAVFNFVGPAILIELGFISNAKDRAACMDRGKRIAVCEGIRDVLKELAR